MKTSRRGATEPGGERFSHGHIVVFACFIILLIVYGIHYTFGLYLKPILAEFGWSRATTSGAYSLSWLLQGPSSLVMGRLNDKYGPRLVLSGCGVVLFAGIFLTTRISASWQLYLFYGVFAGIGTGGMYVPIVSTIARWFDDKRATMTGIAISGMGFGTFLLSPVASYLISNYNWRTSYTLLGVVLLIGTVLSAQLLKLPSAPSTPLVDKPSHAEAKRTIRDVHSISFKDAFARAEFWIVFAMFACFGFCLLAVLVHTAAHATDIGKSPGIAAGLVAAIGISSIAGKIFFGFFGDRIGSRKIYIISFAIMVLSLGLPISIQHALLLYLFATLFGLAYGGNACSQSPLVAEIFGLKAHGVIMGALNTGFTTGATLGPFVAGFLFDLKGTYDKAFLVIGAVSLVGLALAVFLTHRNLRRN